MGDGEEKNKKAKKNNKDPLLKGTQICVPYLFVYFGYLVIGIWNLSRAIHRIAPTSGIEFSSLCFAFFN